MILCTKPLEDCAESEDKQQRVQRYEKHETYYKGLRHSRDEKPSVIIYSQKGESQLERWHHNGKEHRENDLPCIIYHASYSIIQYMYYIHGKKHRDGGKPAIIFQVGTGIENEYWLDNIQQ